MRLIDAEKFEVFNATCPITKGIRSGKTAAYFYGEGCRKVLEAIDAAPTIDPESLRPTAHWTSVKDRLPDPYEKVLVRLDHWSGVDTYLAFYDTERGWCDYGGYFDDGTNNDGEPLTYETAGVNVTHWMSLPKLPEEEGYYV